MATKKWALFSLLSLFLAQYASAIPQSGLADQSVDSLLQFIDQNPQKLKNDALFPYAHLALDKAQLSGEPEKVGDAHTSLAALHRNYPQSYDSILYHAQQALLFYTEIDDQLKIANSHLNIGYSFLNKLSFLSAEEHMMKAIEIYETLNAQSQLSGAYELSSYMFQISGSYEDAGKYAQQSYFVAKSVQDTTQIIAALSILIPIYIEKGQDSLALTKANECFEWINSYANVPLARLIDFYYYRGNAFISLNRLDEAMRDHTQAWELAKSNYSESEVSIFYTSGIAYIQQLKGDYPTAIETNKRLLAYLYRVKEFENLVETHERLAKCYEEIGSYKEALTQSEFAWHLQDSIKTLRSNSLASELQIR